MLRLSASVLLLSAGLCTAADDVRIADIAPPSTLFVFGMDSWSSSHAALKDSELWALWQEPEVQSFVEAIWKDEEVAGGFDELKTMLEELGVDKDELAFPTGSVGMAMFVPPPAAGQERDPLNPLGNEPGLLIFADFGENAEKMKTQVEAAMDRLETKGDYVVAEETYEGSTVWVLTPKEQPEDEKEPEDKPAPAAGMEGEDEPEFNFDFEEGEDEPAFKEMRMAWVKTHMVMCTAKNEMQAAMDRLGGEGDIESIADNDAYGQILAQHPGNLDGFGAFIISDPIRESFREGLGSGMMMATGGGAPEDAQRIFDALGLSNLKGMGLGLKLNSDKGITEQTLSVLAPAKTGLLSLFDGPASRFTPPSFIGAEISSLTQINVQFAKIFDIAAAVAAALPGDVKDQAVAGVQSGEGMFGAAVKSLGPEVFIIGSYTRPLTAESQKSVVAIKTSDALAISNIITGFAPQFGAEIRDFQGSPIFEQPDAGMALGLGGGFMFIGTTEEVENSLRRAGMPDAAGLAAEARFQAAQAVAGEDSQVYGYVDLPQSLEWDFWSMSHAGEIAIKQMEEFMEVTDEMRAEYAKLSPSWTKAAPSIETFKRHLGDTVFHMKSTPDGFRGSFIQLRPTK